mmetsp:Transcript_5328/g.12645  ORF Transcript_5328/g.12645 Transcript_5328/m.12645 type:complete len:779 (-) Transcript_5328:15-2351(-)
MKDSSSSSSAQQSPMASTLAAMGLFVATAAVSQWIQLHHASRESPQTPPRSSHKHRRRRRRRRGSRSTSCDEDWLSCNTSVDEDSNLIMSKEAFRRRRLARRMSFEQVDEDEQQQQQYSRRNSVGKSTDGEAHSRGHRSGQQSPAVAKTEPVTEWSLHCAVGDILPSQGSCSQESTQLKQQQHQCVPVEVSGQHERNKTTNHPRLDRELTTPHSNQSAPNYRYHDFHPKYQNWRHFEHFNDHERKQKRKVQLSRLKHETIQQQNQQPPPQQQEAGEGASQRDIDEQRIQTAAQESGGNEPIIQHHPQKQAEIDNASDNDSLSTLDNERESDNENRNESLSDSVTSFGSDNQYSWTGANTNLEIDGAFRTRQQKRTKNPFGPPLPNKSLNVNRLAICSGTTGARDNAEGASSGGSRKKIKTKKRANQRMGKFERFYRMLTESFIDDESNHVGGGVENTNRVSISSESTNFGSSSNSTSFDYDGDVEDRHRALRTEYNAQIMPEKLVLIRHGQSMGNVDETYYAKISDNAMPLTDLGWEQGRKAGTILKDKIITPGESVHFIVSPYVRTVETFHGIVSAWCDPESEEFATIKDRNRKVNAWYERLTELGLTWNEDSRIREQDFGNYQNPEQTRKAKEERHRFGAFYYRFHNGESGSDVYDRVSTFLDSLWRSFETNKSQNYVLVTHGIVLRVLMARYFRYTITQLNTLANPRNCEMVVLGHEGNGRLDLEGRCMLELEEDPETKKKVVKGYKFHKRLRVLPKSNIRKVRFRISAKDQTSI